MNTITKNIYSDELVTIGEGVSFARTGYTLDKYTANANGTGTIYAINSQTRFTSNTTLYAHWEELRYTFIRPTETYITPGGMTTKVYSWGGGVDYSSQQGRIFINFTNSVTDEVTTEIPRGTYDLFLDGADSIFHGQVIEGDGNAYFYLCVKNAANNERTVYGLTVETRSLLEGFNANECDKDLWRWYQDGYSTSFGFGQGLFATCYGTTVDTAYFSGNHAFFRWGSRAKQITLPYESNQIHFMIESSTATKYNLICGDIPGSIKQVR